MSRESYFDYEIERERRRELYNARITANTKLYLTRYMSQYEDLKRNRYENIIPKELNRLKADLNNIESDLERGNAEAARSLSMAVGGYIYELKALASAVSQQKYEQQQLELKREREQAKKVKSEAMENYYRVVGCIEDPIVVSLARTKLAEVRASMQQGKIQSQNISAVINKIVEEFAPQAEEWKRKTIKDKQQEILAEQIKSHLEQVASKKLEDAEKQQEFIKKIQSLYASVSKGDVDKGRIQGKLAEIENEHTEEIVTEDIRKETVKAIVSQLKKQGFSIKAPVLKDGYVLINASMPAGNHVGCKISLDGKLRYRFDNYEGMTCLKDIEKFNVDLAEVYSVKLSDERVLWGNPDRIQKDAQDNIVTNRRSL